MSWSGELQTKTLCARLEMAAQKFTLIENALDSLEHAISHLNSMPNEAGPGAFKRIILDLAHVAELLFKQKLGQIHPTFILANVDKYPSTTTTTANTVSAADAIMRLQRIGNVELMMTIKVR